jgi:hypothetical protein
VHCRCSGAGQGARVCGVTEGRCPCGGPCTAVFAALRCKGQDLYEGALIVWDVGLVKRGCE